MMDLAQQTKALVRQLRDLDPTNEPETTKQIGRESADLIEILREKLLTIELSARGSGPLARDHDADTLRAIERHCRPGSLVT